MATLSNPNARGDDTGADVELYSLGSSIVSAIGALSETTEASRRRSRELRLALHAAVDARFDEIDESIETSSTAKAASLDRELVEVDSMLHQRQTERSVASTAAATAGDDDLAVQLAALSIRLNGEEATMYTCPDAVLEPPLVMLVIDAATVFAGIATLGRVVAPLAVRATDVALTGMPPYVREGDVVSVSLSLVGERHTLQSAEELEVSLGMAAASSRFCAVLTLPGPAASAGMAVGCVSVTARPAERRVVATLAPLPPGVPREATLTVTCVAVAGRAATGLSASAPVKHGVLVPAVHSVGRVGWYRCSPCLTPEGVLYLPDDDESTVMAFGADGARMPPVQLGPLQLSFTTRWSAYCGGAPGAMPARMLLADCIRSDSAVVAVDGVTLLPLWRVRLGGNSCGIAVLPQHGVAVVSQDSTPPELLVVNLEDGSIAARVGTGCRVQFLAADGASGAVFVGDAEAPHCVRQWSWAGGTLVHVGLVTAAGSAANSRPVVVVPPAPGKTISHLVVGTLRKSDLRVLALPGLALVHTHELGRGSIPFAAMGLLEDPWAANGVHVMGLAADPWGCAIAVVEYHSDTAAVLPWPLPGMPRLA